MALGRESLGRGPLGRAAGAAAGAGVLGRGAPGRGAGQARGVGVREAEGSPSMSPNACPSTRPQRTCKGSKRTHPQIDERA